MTPTLVSVVVLAVIVLIRTFLSFSLSVEIDGYLPWRRGSTHAPDDVRSSTPSGPGAPGDIRARPDR